MARRFADVLLPLAAPMYTFSIPDSLSERIGEGCLVAVPLGARKIYTGVVWRMHSTPPQHETVKPILGILYPERAVSASQMKFWEWMAEYYMCRTGEVMRSALPARLKAEGFSAEEFEADVFSPRKQRFVALGPEVRSLENLDKILAAMKRSPKRRAAVQDLAARLGSSPFEGRVPRNFVSLNTEQLSALERQGILRVFEDEPSQSGQPSFELPALTEAQNEASKQIETCFADKDTVLLHGVMSSGKSEVFLSLAARTLSAGGDVLVLLPEISVTAQFVRRVQRIFGEDGVTLYHSGLTDRARAEAYVRIMRAGTPQIVVGTRSALFLPFRSLRLIVVDEEHDSSYKQADPAPRYSGRDAALMLARICGAKSILSSATPSLESYSNALGGRYGLVRLTQRYGDSPAPQIVLSDTSRAVRRGERKLHFNKQLIDATAGAVEEGRQVLLFQNRRGLAPYVECTECGWSARCEMCGVAMTLHSDGLRCHYCGRTAPMPEICPSCSKRAVAACGFGTEKIEDVLARLLPFARTARLDRDTATSEAAYRRTVDDFENGRTDILVGTQIITKGFDFERLSVVGVLNADNLLNFPDFRASERAFATLTQISGRAGRRNVRGTVIIQTSQPENPVLQQVVAGDYEAFARDALHERAVFGYPPYSRIVSITLRHADSRTLCDAAQDTAARLRTVFGADVLGPQAPAVEFTAGRHNSVIMVKVRRDVPMSEARRSIAAAIEAVSRDKRYKGIHIIPNVDPM